MAIALTLPGVAGEAGGDGVGEEERGRAGGRADGAGHAVGRLTRGRGDAQPRAGREPRIGDDLVGALGSAAGGQRVGRQGGARPSRGRSAGPSPTGRPAASNAPTGKETSPTPPAKRLTSAASSSGAGATSTDSSSSMAIDGSAWTTASAAAKRPGPGALSAPGHQQPRARRPASPRARGRRTRPRASRGSRAASASEIRSTSLPQPGHALGDLLGASGRAARRRAGRRP